MSIEQNKSIVRRFFEEVFNQGNLPVADEIFAPEFDGHGLVSHGVTGPERAKQTIARFRTAFPDIHFTVEELIGEADKVVVRVTFRGTHQGEFMGIPATGRQVAVSGVELARLASGKIVEESWHFFNDLSLMQQLGVLPEHGHRPQ